MLRLLPLLAAIAAASPSPQPEPASMSLEVAPAPGGLFQLVATNTGDEVLRFGADIRLARLEVTPPFALPEPGARAKPKAPKMVECSLPADARLSDIPHERAVLLEPGDSWREVFDPALFCFGKKEREALVPGATVVVKFGFLPVRVAKGKLPPPPHVAAPTALEPSVHGVRELVAEAFTFVKDQPEVSPSPTTETTNVDLDPSAPKLSVSTTSHLDAKDERAVALSTTLRNTGKRPMLVHLRRDQLFFDVEGPTGLYRCGPSNALRAVPRDFFRKFSPHQSRVFSLRLAEICPNGAFSRPGLYRVRAGVFVTDGGADPSLGAFQGIAISEETTLVRVRTGPRPFYVMPPTITKSAEAEGEPSH